MSTRPLISVVLPTYNGARYLPEAIESCRGQSYDNWELLIVDDASTDETPSIVEAFISRDPRIRSVRHDRNRKLPGALNTGFRHSRGQLLTWTSDDNLFLPNTLDKLVRYLEDRPHVDLVYAGCIGIDENGDRLEEGRILTAALEILPLRNCIGACFLYRRHVYEKLGDYDPESFLVEDYEYWIRASINFTIHYLDEALYLYRVHPKSLSCSMRFAVLVAIEKCLSRHLPSIKWACRWTVARSYANLAGIAFLRDDDVASGVHIKCALCTYPFGIFSVIPLRLLAFGLLPRSAFRLLERLFGKYDRKEGCDNSL